MKLVLAFHVFLSLFSTVIAKVESSAADETVASRKLRASHQKPNVAALLLDKEESYIGPHDMVEKYPTDVNYSEEDKIEEVWTCICFLICE
jgi:hypothetical protein